MTRFLKTHQDEVLLLMSFFFIGLAVAGTFWIASVLVKSFEDAASVPSPPPSADSFNLKAADELHLGQTP